MSLEDFEYCGQCPVCEEHPTHSDAGICGECGEAFCWGKCGDWHPDKSEHCCENCKPKEVECKTCEGSGYVEDPDTTDIDEGKDCEDCDGTGIVREQSD